MCVHTCTYVALVFSCPTAMLSSATKMLKGTLQRQVLVLLLLLFSCHSHREGSLALIIVLFSSADPYLATVDSKIDALRHTVSTNYHRLCAQTRFIPALVEAWPRLVAPLVRQQQKEPQLPIMVSSIVCVCVCVCLGFASLTWDVGMCSCVQGV